MRNKKLFIFGVILIVVSILMLGACFIWVGFPFEVYDSYFPIISGMFFFGFVGLAGGIGCVIFGGKDE